MNTEKFEWLKRIGFELKASADSQGAVATLGEMQIAFRGTFMMIEDHGVYNWQELRLIPFQYIIRGYMLQVLGIIADEHK